MVDPKQRFLREFRHSDDDHRPVEEAELLTDDRWSAALTRAHVGGVSWPGGRPTRCGWWWCSGNVPDPLWKDLARALVILRQAGIDPSSRGVAQLAERVPTADAWATEQSQYEKLLDGLRQVDVSGEALRLRRKWLEELSPHVRTLRDRFPRRSPGRRGPPQKVGLREVLLAAHEMGLTGDIVAASLLLLGADKRPLKAITKSIGDARRREPIPQFKNPPI